MFHVQERQLSLSLLFKKNLPIMPLGIFLVVKPTEPALVAQSAALPAGDQEVTGSIPARTSNVL